MLAEDAQCSHPSAVLSVRWKLSRPPLISFPQQNLTLLQGRLGLSLWSEGLISSVSIKEFRWRKPALTIDVQISQGEMQRQLMARAASEIEYRICLSRVLVRAVRGQRSLAGCSPRGRTESDTTKAA